MQGAGWMDCCKSKLMSLGKAIQLIKPGQRIYLSAGSATPLGLIPGLLDPTASLGDHEIVHLMTLGDAPYVRPEWRSRFRHNALFIGSNVREAVVEGRADYTPIFLSEIPALIRSGRLPIDVLSSRSRRRMRMVIAASELTSISRRLSWSARNASSSK